MNLRLPRLVAISPGDLRNEQQMESFVARAAQALQAGLPALLLREPDLSDRSRLRLLERLLPHASTRELWMHDAVHLLRAPGLAGVHLGFRSLTALQARALLPMGKRVGFSAHAGDEASRWRGADYLFASPVLPTDSKRGLLPVLGWDGLRTLVRRTELPVLALGGLGAEHVEQALACGAYGIAVRGAVFGARDCGAAVGELLRSLDPVR